MIAFSFWKKIPPIGYHVHSLQLQGIESGGAHSFAKKEKGSGHSGISNLKCVVATHKQ